MGTAKRERQKERRAARLAAEAKLAQRRRRLRNLRTLLITAAIVFGGGFLLSVFVLGNGDEPPPTTVASPTATTSPGATETTVATPQAGQITDAAYLAYRDQPVACEGELPSPAREMSFAEPEDQEIASEATVTATITTSCGDLRLELDPAAAPETVNSFVFLARQGYFDGTASHRIIPGFMMQAGDPSATGGGNPGYSLPEESPEPGGYRRGVLAMANAGPGTGGSQFFILFDQADHLGTNHAIFGEMLDGFETLDLIEQIPTGDGDRPLESLFIEKVEIEVT